MKLSNCTDCVDPPALALDQQVRGRVDEWQEYALRELPEDIDPETRASVHSRVAAVVAETIGSGQHAIRHGVDLAISEALVPYVRWKHRQAAIKHALARLPCDRHHMDDSREEARRWIAVALATLPKNTDYAELAAAAGRVVASLSTKSKTGRFRAA